MRRVTILMLVVLVPCLALPGVSRAEVRHGKSPFLRAFRELVSLVRDASQREYRRIPNRDLRLRKLGEVLHYLRGPDLSSPTGYRYVRLVRKGSYKTLGGATIHARYTDPVLQQIRGTVQGAAYEVNLYVPRYRRKRRSNHAVYVRALRIVFYDRGRPKVIENAFTGWLRRGRKKAIPLPVIAGRVDVQAWVGTKAGDANKAYLRIQVAQPTKVDLPSNPHHALVTDLLALRPTLKSSFRRDSALLALRGILEKLGVGDAAAGASFGFFRRMQYVLFLLDGDPRDIRRAKGELATLIDEMRARTPTPGMGITIPPVSRPIPPVSRPGRPHYGNSNWPPRPPTPPTPPAPPPGYGYYGRLYLKKGAASKAVPKGTK